MHWKGKYDPDCPCKKNCEKRHVTPDGKPCRIDCPDHAKWQEKKQAEYAANAKRVEQNGVNTEGGDRLWRRTEREKQRKQRGGGYST